MTGPVVATPAGRGGVAGGGGGGGGGGRGGAGGEITFVVMPGPYAARLTIGPSRVMDRPFSLLRDEAVILADADLRQLNATRLTIARLQAGLRETQARLDSVQRQVTDARRAADSSSATPANAKEQLVAIEAEVASIVSLIGGAGGGRGGAGGAGGGAGRAGRAGGAGAGRGGEDDDQQGPPPTPPTQTITARLGSMGELMTGQYNPNPDQRRAAAELPALLRQQDERLQRILRDRLPAVVQVLKSAGVMK